MVRNPLGTFERDFPEYAAAIEYLSRGMYNPDREAARDQLMGWVKHAHIRAGVAPPEWIGAYERDRGIEVPAPEE